MPTRQFFHKNRSQGSLLNNIHDLNERKPPIDSPLHSPIYSPHSASASPSLQDNDEDYHLGRHDRPEQSQQSYSATPPTRSHSQRVVQPPSYSQHPSVNVATHSQGGFGVDENPDSYYLPQPPVPTEPKDDRKRRFFGLRNPKEPATYNVGGNNPSRPPGRHTSVVRRKPQPPLPDEVINHSTHQRYSNSIATPASAQEQERGAGRIQLHPQTIEAAPPPIPEKDPQRPPQLQNLQPQTQQPQQQPQQQQQQQHKIISVSTSQDAISNSNLIRPQLERQISASSSAFEDPVRSSQQSYRLQSDLQHQQPPVYLPSPSSIISNSPNHPVPPRGAHETVHQNYRDNSRPSSQQSFGPPSPLQQTRAVNPYPYIQGPTSAYPPTSGSMAPPPSQQQSQGRNSHDVPPLRQPIGISREGSAYQPYSQSTQEAHQGSGAPPHYRGQIDTNQHRAPPQQSQSNVEHGQIQGRSTPPPSRSRDDLAGLDPAQLLTRHDELQDKYRKVKKYYFEKEAQLQQLQNTLAHQRLSQSRTSLDDSEYVNRFSRLDGAINNLSFNIRKDWLAVPPWLSPFVNRDAHTQTREMVAVGRACVSRWLVDELLDRYFHPCIDPLLSAHLKVIERNLRRFAAPTPSEEEREALMARISNWRLATLDGLQDMLSSPQADEYRNQLVEQLVKKLVENLAMNLRDPLQTGVEDAVIGIVQLAVGIAANLPQESRDVFVHYVTPGSLANENLMKIESGLPALTNPGEASSEGVTGEKPSEDVGGAAEQKENNPSGGVEESAASVVGPTNTGNIAAGGANSGSTKETKKKSMFGALMGGVKKGTNTPNSSTHQQQQQQQQQQQPPPLPPQVPREERVRFSAFMAVEVRGRSVLMKAPVYV